MTGWTNLEGFPVRILMKTTILFSSLAIALINALALLPTMAEARTWMAIASLLLAVGMAARFAIQYPRTIPASPGNEAIPDPVRPDPEELGEQSARFACASLLAQLQEKGRFIDFVMEDVSKATDTQLGAVARVVHQGCSEVIRSVVSVEPIRNEPEGAQIPIPTSAERNQYRIQGDLNSAAAAKILHRGWRIQEYRLSRPADPTNSEPPVLAPAQIKPQ